ncbi:hypothetical protein ACJMK2_024657 [Sinanodonta woodiana]|uniref:Uncharacterized protein n=1 Tax=Sinanodonta woodiana TaxID=1069815 RepID=A0ABD3XGH0_SINWO
MATIIRIYVFLLLIGIADTTEWRPGTFVTGENVTVCMDRLQIKGTHILQINFAGFISKQHVSNVLLYNPLNTTFDQLSVNSNYTGRIEKFETNQSSLSFLLLNVKIMESGMYTVTTMEGSVVKGNTSILVARQRILGQLGDSMNITFMCNKANISSIQIEMFVPKASYRVVIYDLTQANCTVLGTQFINRIENCILSGTKFSFTIKKITWLEIGTYAALDDRKFLLDSLFVVIEDTKTSSVETSNGYVTLPSTVNEPTDSSMFATEQGRRFISQDGELGTHVLLCNNKNMYLVKTDIILTNITSHVGVANVTHGNCTLLMQRYTARITGCPFSANNLSYTFREVSWLHGVKSTAYNDSEFRLDSVFINIQSAILETRNQYQTSSSGAMFDQDPVSSNDMPELLIFSAVVVFVVAACLAMIAVWMIRRRKVPTTTTNEIKYTNSRASTTQSSGNLYKNTNQAIHPEETRLVSGTSDNVVNQTNLNKGQVNDRLKEENRIHRRFECADSSTRTTRNFQIDSLAHLYDYIPEHHDHCWPYESKLRSSPNSTGVIPFEYDYVVQHSFMTLRPPALDPLVTRKSTFGGTRNNSISWYKGLNIKTASILNPLTSYAEISTERHIENNCTISSSEQGSSYLMNQSAPSHYFELECIRATGTRNSLSSLRYGEGQNWSSVENLKSTNFVKKPGFSELRDTSIHQIVAPDLNYDLPRCHFDHPCSKDRRHRKRQSLDGMLAIASVRWSRRRSTRSCMKNDWYDSL